MLLTTLKKGTSDPDVLYIQGHLGLTLDGSYGPKTEEAVRQWQARVGLPVTGVMGNPDWEALMKITRRPMGDSDWTALARDLGTGVPELKAIKEVETGSKGAWDSSQRPCLLFEAHLFWRNLKAAGIDPEKHRPGHPGILKSSWDRALYKGGPLEWDRLREAWGISKTAALQSASYGFPQVLAQNFPDPFKFVSDCYQSEAAQAKYFGEFLKVSGILPHLRSHSWAEVARRYNGPGYAKNRYDQRLAEAYKKYGNLSS